MIDGLLNVFAAVVAWMLGLLPHLAVPSWLSDASGSLSVVTGGLAGTAGWLPWTYLALGVALALAALVVSVSIRGFRIALSFLTLGGGS